MVPFWLAVAPCPFGLVAGRSQGQTPHVLDMIVILESFISEWEDMSNGAELDILSETIVSFTDKCDCFEIHILISTWSPERIL